MGFIEVICDSYTALTTSITGKKPTDTPLFNFGQGWKNIIGLKVQEVTVPVTWYNWRKFENSAIKHSTDNQLVFFSLLVPVFFNMRDAAGNLLVAGQGLTYTAPELAAALTTFMNSAAFTGALTLSGMTGPYANTCVYNNATHNFTFNIVPTGGFPIGSPPFFLIRSENVAADSLSSGTGNGRSLLSVMLGLPMGQSLFTSTATGYTLTTGFANVGGFNTLYLCSKTLGPLCALQPNYQTRPNEFNYNVQDSSEQLAHIPINVNYGDVLTWQAPDRTGYFEISNLNNLQSFDLFWNFGPFMEPVEFNGIGFQVKLLLEQSVETLAVDQKVKRRKYY